MASQIIRTERGATISGTRITLYDVLGYLRAQWSVERTQDILRLTDAQMLTALEYISAHRAEVAAEYEQVQHEAADACHYWEQRNRERLESLSAMPPTPGTEALRSKLAEHRARRTRDNAQPTSA